MAATPKRTRVTNSSSPVTDSDVKLHSQELGGFGRLFGSRENAPIYIAGILGFIALVGAIAVGILASVSPDKSDLVKALVGIVIAALSFIGGASGRGQAS